MNRISAQIIDVGESIIRRERREVCVGGRLPVSVRAVLCVVLGPHGLAQLAVFNAKAGRTRARVVRGEQHAAGRIHSHVAGARAG